MRKALKKIFTMHFWCHVWTDWSINQVSEEGYLYRERKCKECPAAQYRYLT